MLSARTTVIAVLAATDEEAERAVSTLATARNVRRIDVPADEADASSSPAGGAGEGADLPVVNTSDPAHRTAAVLAEAARTRAPYAVQRLDPLEDVAWAWRRFFDRLGGHGELEVAVADTLRRWRAGALELPDYYLAVEPDTWPPTLRHWVLGILHGTAPHRVVPVSAPPAPPVLARLDAGRWWPPLDRLLSGLRERAPETLQGSGRRGAHLLDPAGRAHPPAAEFAGTGAAPDAPEGSGGFPTLDDLARLEGGEDLEEGEDADDQSGSDGLDE
ncbi:hypothetical protein ER308_17605 [Egibacter rhizosphaerae]|uniref:Uncharacterized protein n=1 Tax=Egibacter rhizosphaerae TaxID=1670831 RepID=A0A411YIS1_9ACTN|nr:hypothetical protein [Egibacter rhizosphaerae]QBI21205.1 hypothetical protein ER308_17605 [Egibacter rhizosphaerae]